MIDNTTQAPAAAPPEIPLGKFPYGWQGVASTRSYEKPTGEFNEAGEIMEHVVEVLPFPAFYNREWTHEPRTIIVGAPKRGGKFANIEPKTRRQLIRHQGCKGTRYIVFSDRSLRRVDKLLRKQFLKMTPAQQNELIEQAAVRAQEAA